MSLAAFPLPFSISHFAFPICHLPFAGDFLVAFSSHKFAMQLHLKFGLFNLSVQHTVGISTVWTWICNMHLLAYLFHFMDCISKLNLNGRQLVFWLLSQCGVEGEEGKGGVGRGICYPYINCIIEASRILAQNIYLNKLLS